MVSYDQIEICITNLYKYLPHNEVSFQVGQHYFGNGNLLFETALMNAKNLNEVIRLTMRFSFNGFSFVKVRNYNSKDQLHFAVSPGIKHSSDQHELFFYEILLSAISMFISWRFPDLSNKIDLPYASPFYIEQYQCYLKFPCQFSQPLFLITINKDTLSTKKQNSSEILRKQALAKLTELKKKVK